MITIYISTDSNEVRGILEPVKLGEEEFVRDYNFSIDRIRLNGQSFLIKNFPVDQGKEIQKTLELHFNPMSVISGNINAQNKNHLIKKLVNEGLKVDEVDNRGVKHHFSNKYGSYQGGGFI